MDLRQWLIPQDKEFFDLFEEMVGTVVEAANALVELMNDYTDLGAKSQHMKELEHEGDRITHAIYEGLNRTFITPLEPEEISRLATAMDDVIDCIEGTVQQLHNYGIPATDSPMRQFSKLIQLSATEMQTAVKGIRSMKDVQSIEARCIELNRLENVADEVLGHALTELFRGSDPLTIIKLKDVYENLEQATDRCEDVANVLSDIVIRHS
ncbi:DUF47 domain-containing protein [Methanosphaerula palustris]|uniref:Phosphate transport regulator n=1 Tax=Methanosphaerula palustris (strain ATCC BAA-1556 / DSM 19958 / E1-9c) TaxID=521011 RepID=B8GKX4_METPE|nr:DUF47 family protein [Methanosphaerula palustris]ACL17270.1 protein of unknown function DUF47 [Methanosphaerula palustris E1-9c]